MSILDAALEDLPYADRRRIEVVFVTTDPDRDTPERLRAWLDRFDTSFVGLHGDFDRVNEILGDFKLPASMIEPPQHPVGSADAPSGDEPYYVGHATPVLAITGDGLVRALYPSGVRQTDWQHDLPLLLDLDASVAGVTAESAERE